MPTLQILQMWVAVWDVLILLYDGHQTLLDGIHLCVTFDCMDGLRDAQQGEVVSSEHLELPFEASGDDCAIDQGCYLLSVSEADVEVFLDLVDEILILDLYQVLVLGPGILQVLLIEDQRVLMLIANGAASVDATSDIIESPFRCGVCLVVLVEVWLLIEDELGVVHPSGHHELVDLIGLEAADATFGLNLVLVHLLSNRLALPCLEKLAGIRGCISLRTIDIVC